MKGAHHKGAADVMALLLVLARRHGALGTGELAQAAEVHRDTARRILRELAAAGWVRLVGQDEGEVWSLGPELPRLGLDWQRRLVEAARELHADHTRLMQPLEES